MKEIYAEIEIDTSAARVWEILMDFASYPEWNPFIREISGDARVGSMLRVRFQPPGGRGMTFKPKLQRIEPAREIRWLGKLFISGLFDGEHALTIKQLEGDRVIFSQHEKFTGLLVPLLFGTLKGAAKGFEAMNRALKQRAELTGK
jgi:hypothetical protein